MNPRFISVDTSGLLDGQALFYDRATHSIRGRSAGGQSTTGALTRTEADGLYRLAGFVQTFDALSGKPTTLGGYGITDALSSAQFLAFMGGTLSSDLDTVIEIISHIHDGDTAFGTLTNAISSEAARAQSVEAGLTTNVAENATAISQEISDRVDADDALAALAQIDAAPDEHDDDGNDIFLNGLVKFGAVVEAPTGGGPRGFFSVTFDTLMQQLYRLSNFVQRDGSGDNLTVIDPSINYPNSSVARTLFEWVRRLLIGAQIDNAAEETDDFGNDVFNNGMSFIGMFEHPTASDGSEGTTSRGARKFTWNTFLDQSGITYLKGSIGYLNSNLPYMRTLNITASNDFSTAFPVPPIGRVNTLSRLGNGAGKLIYTMPGPVDGMNVPVVLFYANDSMTVQWDGVNFKVISWKINGAVPLTYSTTIIIDCSQIPDNGKAKVTLTGNATLGTPINYRKGQRFTLYVKQDATGSRTLGFTTGSAGSQRFSTSLPAPTLTTTSGKTDKLTFMHDEDADRFDLLEVGNGF